MRNRQEEIRNKGFAFTPRKNSIEDYGKMRVGLKTLEDAILDLNWYKKLDSQRFNKDFILKALANHDYQNLRELSLLFFETSGIYQRLCKYLASLFKFDWYVIPFIGLHESDKVNNTKILKEFSGLMNYLDNSYLKKQFYDIALKTIIHGCYYGILVPNDDCISFQQLPINYCRSRFSNNGIKVVEFNMKYFDDTFRDANYRLRILKTFPKDVQKGYSLYKQGKLTPEYQGDSAGWYLLDTNYAFKISCGETDFPILANVLPSILDLADAQALDRKKTMQKLLKIIIQKLPLDKNGDLIFDVDEAADIHANAVAMLSRAVGVDVLTTFADIEVADMADSNSATTVDDLEKVERGVYNESGVSKNLFNSDSNLALTNSILDDEASMRSLPQQFEILMGRFINYLLKPRKYSYKFRILETTIYNYKELSKMYKEQSQLGYQKMLPPIALGHSQSEILGAAHFENEILNLSGLLLPLMSSNTISGSDILSQSSGSEEAGRPEKEDSEKSDKTIANKESM